MLFDFRHLALLEESDRNTAEYACVFCPDRSFPQVTVPVARRAKECGEDLHRDGLWLAMQEGGDTLLRIMLDLDMGD